MPFVSCITSFSLTQFIVLKTILWFFQYFKRTDYNKNGKTCIDNSGGFSEELLVGTLLSFLFFLVADSVKWYNCFSYSISNSCLDVKITWFVNNANCVAKSRLVNLTMSEKRNNARLGMKGKSITLIQKRVCKKTRDTQIYTLHLMLMWFKKTNTQNYAVSIFG